MAAYHSNKLILCDCCADIGPDCLYMFRLYFSVFWKRDIHLHDKIHEEGTLSMKLPLVILAICTAFAGFVPFSSWITSDGVPLESHIDIGFSAFPY